MNLETTIPWSWLKTAANDVKILDERPLFGASPPFPWELFSKELAKVLGIQLQVVLKNTEWLAKLELLSKLGDNPVIRAFAIPGLEGNAYLMFSKASLQDLFSSLQKELPDEDWQKEWAGGWEEEFYQFLLLQSLEAFKNIKFDPDLSPEPIQENFLPETACLCFDINLITERSTIFGRVALSPDMRASIKKKYTPKTLAYPDGLKQSLTATLHVSIGSASLTRKEWDEVDPGDFLILDTCTYTPGKEDKGRAVLTINNTPIFRVKIKENSLKLLEFPLLQEVSAPMIKHEDDEDFDETFETEDETLEDHDEEDHDEDHFDEDHDNFDHDEEEEDHSDDSTFHEADKTIEEDSALDSDKEVEDRDLPSTPPLPSRQEKQSAPKHPMESAKNLLKTSGPDSLIKPEQIPLTISIEVARIQMSIDQLLQLAPGNMLDLEVSPENGVDLVVNGRCIGKGELLSLGETLGVRILDKA